MSRNAVDYSDNVACSDNVDYSDNVAYSDNVVYSDNKVRSGVGRAAEGSAEVNAGWGGPASV